MQQTAIFPASAPLLFFVILVTGLLLELCMRLALPLPQLGVSATFTVHRNTVARCALIWAEARWSGLWELPALCVGARAAIWAGVAADSLEERYLPCAADGAGVSTWEDVESWIRWWPFGGCFHANVP